MKRIIWNSLSSAQRSHVLQRPGVEQRAELTSAVARIIEQVSADGDSALRALTRRFDGVELAAMAVAADGFAAAEAAVSPALRQAMQAARARLIAWHEAGRVPDFSLDTAPGVSCGRVQRPIHRVGLYVPAGSAPLPSTALMLGVPAQLAGCAQVVLCTPPRADGSADPAVLVAAALCGISQVFTLGGAQAIAAMGLGTETVPRCDKLFGPGNAYVTAAKQQLAMRLPGLAIDMPAGPSEVLVIADAGASAVAVAADLLSQAEHGPDSQVLLLSDDGSFIDRVIAEIAQQCATLPRADIARAALTHARLIEVETIAQAFAISNDYGPEHLLLAVRDAAAAMSQVHCAGSVFLGDYAPESVGDYCSGTNHVLPTGGAARAWSGVSLSSFQTSISVQSLSREGLSAIGPCAVELARAEGLEAHAQAVLRRLSEKGQ